MLTKKDIETWSTDHIGWYAECAATKILIKQGWNVEKIKSNVACNDLILTKADIKYVAEIKAAVDFGYPSHFFCEIASKSVSDVKWNTSFWLGQDIDIFCYYSFRDNKIYLYNGKLFRRAALDKLGTKDIFTIPAATAQGFKFSKLSESHGFMGCCSISG